VTKVPLVEIGMDGVDGSGLEISLRAGYGEFNRGV
jgi:hypothetical protein